MKTLVFKVVCMTAIFVGASNYMIYLTTGKSPLSFSLPNLKEITSSIDVPDIRRALPSKPTTELAYKWQDANGVIHYSSEPPPEGQAAKLLEVDPDTNLVQGLQVPKKKEENVERRAEPPQIQAPTYHPDTGAVQKLTEDAKAVQEKLNKRYEEMNDI